MTTKYDPDLLQEYADRLYRRARWLTGWYGFLGFVGGWILDFIIAAWQARTSPPGSFQGWDQWVLPLLGVLVGYVYGSGKAYELKLDAQRTLCQLQIEVNTRPPSSAAMGAA